MGIYRGGSNIKVTFVNRCLTWKLALAGFEGLDKSKQWAEDHTNPASLIWWPQPRCYFHINNWVRGICILPIYYKGWLFEGIYVSHWQWVRWFIGLWSWHDCIVHSRELLITAFMTNRRHWRAYIVIDWSAWPWHWSSLSCCLLQGHSCPQLIMPHSFLLKGHFLWWPIKSKGVVGQFGQVNKVLVFRSGKLSWDPQLSYGVIELVTCGMLSQWIPTSLPCILSQLGQVFTHQYDNYTGY